MPQAKFQPSFELGEVSPEYLRRVSDVEVMRTAMKRMRNVALRQGGGFRRRPGTEFKVESLSPDSRIVRYLTGGGEIETLLIEAGQALIYDEAGSLINSVGPCPWTTSDLPGIEFTPGDNEIYIFGADFRTQVLTRAANGTWSVADFTFSAGAGDAINQPYLRIAPRSITMGVSAYTGASVTVSFSSPVLQSGHVGTRFRYMEANEIEITAVTNSTTATGTVRQRLYPTINLTIPSGAAQRFKVGHVVIGDVSEASAVVVGVSGTSLSVTKLDGYGLFEVIDTEIEKLVGPEGSVVPSAQSDAATPASVSIWDEQLISAVRGYPATAVVHRDRLFLAGFPASPNFIAASASGERTNFSLGDQPADGILESLGDDPSAQIRYLVGAEQLIAMTDRGIYYVPEGGENPITPTSIAFNRITPDGIAKVPPALTSEGVLFIDSDAERILAVVPTGNIRRSWETVEIAETGSHLISAPSRLTVADGMDGDPIRYIMVLNGDGSIMSAMYRRGDLQAGCALWSRREGAWVDMAAVGPNVWVIAQIPGRRYLSQFRWSAILDDEMPYTGPVIQRADVFSYVTDGGTVIGSGLVRLLSPWRIPSINYGPNRRIGDDFDVVAETVSPVVLELGVRRMRIPHYRLEVVESGAVRINGVPASPYLVSDDLGNPGFVRSRICDGYSLGWSYAPTIVISQPVGEGTALDVRSLSYEVSI